MSGEVVAKQRLEEAGLATSGWALRFLLIAWCSTILSFGPDTITWVCIGVEHKYSIRKHGGRK